MVGERGAVEDESVAAGVCGGQEDGVAAVGGTVAVEVHIRQCRMSRALEEDTPTLPAAPRLSRRISFNFRHNVRAEAFTSQPEVPGVPICLLHGEHGPHALLTVAVKSIVERCVIAGKHETQSYRPSPTGPLAAWSLNTRLLGLELD